MLTSDKRRGVYECDYCHTDVSQVPRIRCAQCPDFDLCLDCFATTDHSAAIARLKAAATAHGAVDGGGMTPGISASAVNHDDTHKYRVADSTRYPLFPSARVVSKELQGAETMSNDGTEDEPEENQEEKKLDTVKEEEEKPDIVMADASNEEEKKAPAEDASMLKETDAVEASASHEPKAPATPTPTPAQSRAGAPTPTPSAPDSEVGFVKQDDPKTVWTVEEDLRLLDAIGTCGLGNWADIAEAISGQGSSSKTAKRCMERYFDDFLGRYGHVLPAYVIVEDEEDQQDANDEEASEPEPKKRRVERMSSFGVAAMTSGRRGKSFKFVPTGTIAGYENVWPDPYLPPIPAVQVGQEVGRDQRYRAEQVFVKLTTNAASKKEADAIRKEWEENRLNQPNGPTALPMRPEDLPTLAGSELAGFMPRRGDFDMVWEDDAENVLADMEFSPNDLPQDRELKIKVIQIYNSKLDERERRKNFLLSRGLLDYRKNQLADAKLPRDERDLVRRMRLFERLHTPEEHKLFIGDILKAKRLRKEIAQLQMYRRIGIQTLAEAEKYENDKRRREIHKMSHLQKEAEAEKAEGAKAGTKEGAPSTSQAADDDDLTSSLWKQYRTSDRKHRRSINRTAPGETSTLADVKMDIDARAGGPEATKAGPSKEPAKEQTGDKPEESAKGQPEAKDISKEVGEKAAEPAEKVSSEAKDKPAEKTESSDKPVEKLMDEPVDKRTNDEPANKERGEDAMEVDHVETTSGEKEEDKDKEKKDDKDKEKTKSQEHKAEGAVNGDGGFQIRGLPGYDLLTKKEAALCWKLEMNPALYIKVKKAIIQESFRIGILDRESNPSRSIVTIDVKKRGNVIDFMVKAGWITTKAGEAMKQ